MEITSQRQRLDELFEKAKGFDPEIQSHWSRYLCVLISGYLENCVRLTYAEYATNLAPLNVANFVEGNLKSFRNPRMNLILDIVGKFSDDWRKELKAQTDGRLGDAVTSIVVNRHSIVHGQSVQLTLLLLIQYYGDALKVVTLLRQQCGLPV
jgi:hypothetical protein